MEFDNLVKVIEDLTNRVNKLERGVYINNVTIPPTGSLVIQKTATDPVSPTNGQIWYNTTSNSFKCYQNGAVKTFTVS